MTLPRTMRAWRVEESSDAGTMQLDEAELRRHAHQIALRVPKTEDAREGPCAFAEHRAPQWRGR